MTTTKRESWSLLCVAAMCALFAGCGDAPVETGDADVADASLGPDGGARLDLGVGVDSAVPDADPGDDTGTAMCTGPDADGDGILDMCDRCSLGADQLDADLDTVPDACDQCPGFSDLVDTDMDGVAEGCDICAGGDDNADADMDGLPDHCDICDLGPNGPDADADGTPDACDVCAGHPDSADADMDGVPDGCDVCAGANDLADADMDGVPDGCDLCAAGDDAVDTDTDTFPDACDCEPLYSEAHPGLTEVCDGLDNDCAGGVDDGLVGCPDVCRPDEVDWDLDGLCESAGRVIYVDHTATGDADGTSWADAYVTLEAAIVDAESTPAGRKQVWVAAGDYVPSRVLATGTQTIRGFLLPEATALLGGFAGVEFAAVQADPAVSVTRLTPTGTGARMLDVRQLDVVVDGFTVYAAIGSALEVLGAGAVTASRMSFVGTASLGFGEPLVTVGGTATLRQVLVTGGARGMLVPSGTVLCDRCLIQANGVGVSFGGFAAGGLAIGAGSVTLRNSAVIGNAAPAGLPGNTSAAGGVTITGAAGRLRAENSTISGNSGSRLVSFAAVNAGLDVQLGAATLVNSIVQDNTGANTVNATAVSSSVEGDMMACDPLFTAPGTVAGITLGAGSTCIDAGDTSMSQGSVDYNGNARVQGLAVDIGAVETQP